MATHNGQTTTPAWIDDWRHVIPMALKKTPKSAILALGDACRAPYAAQHTRLRTLHLRHFMVSRASAKG